MRDSGTTTTSRRSRISKFGQFSTSETNGNVLRTTSHLINSAKKTVDLVSETKMISAATKFPCALYAHGKRDHMTPSQNIRQGTLYYSSFIRYTLLIFVTNHGLV